MPPSHESESQAAKIPCSIIQTRGSHSQKVGWSQTAHQKRPSADCSQQKRSDWHKKSRLMSREIDSLYSQYQREHLRAQSTTSAAQLPSFLELPEKRSKRGPWRASFLIELHARLKQLNTLRGEGPYVSQQQCSEGLEAVDAGRVQMDPIASNTANNDYNHLGQIAISPMREVGNATNHAVHHLVENISDNAAIPTQVDGNLAQDLDWLEMLQHFSTQQENSPGTVPSSKNCSFSATANMSNSVPLDMTAHTDGLRPLDMTAHTDGFRPLDWTAHTDGFRPLDFAADIRDALSSATGHPQARSEFFTPALSLGAWSLQLPWDQSVPGTPTLGLM